MICLALSLTSIINSQIIILHDPHASRTVAVALVLMIALAQKIELSLHEWVSVGVP